MITKQQHRRLMSILNSKNTVQTAADKAGMDVKTDRKYYDAGVGQINWNNKRVWALMKSLSFLTGLTSWINLKKNLVYKPKRYLKIYKGSIMDDTQIPSCVLYNVMLDNADLSAHKDSNPAYVHLALRTTEWIPRVKPRLNIPCHFVA